MTELVAPFIPVHGSWTFLPDMNCLLDPSGRSISIVNCNGLGSNFAAVSPGLRLWVRRVDRLLQGKCRQCQVAGLRKELYAVSQTCCMCTDLVAIHVHFQHTLERSGLA